MKNLARTMVPEVRYSCLHWEGTGKWRHNGTRRRSAGICLGQANTFGGSFSPGSQCHHCWFTLGNSCGCQTNESATSLPSVFVCETGGWPKARAMKQLFPNGLTYTQPLRPSSPLSSCNGGKKGGGLDKSIGTS